MIKITIEQTTREEYRETEKAALPLGVTFSLRADTAEVIVLDGLQDVELAMSKQFQTEPK